MILAISLRPNSYSKKGTITIETNYFSKMRPPTLKNVNDINFNCHYCFKKRRKNDKLLNYY